MPDLEPLIRKTFACETKVLDAEKRIMEFVISSEIIDRMGDVIEVDGWDLTWYAQNPVFLWGHQYRIPPLGRALDVRVERTMSGDKYLIATDQFAPPDMLPADMAGLFDLYAEGYLRATSVGFLPRAWVYEERDTGDRISQRGYRYTSQELLEHSAVTVPANPEALARAKAAGLELPRQLADGDESHVSIGGRLFTIVERPAGEAKVTEASSVAGVEDHQTPEPVELEIGDDEIAIELDADENLAELVAAGIKQGFDQILGRVSA